ncbi:hypothetical protein E3N88_06962 [Mikania micrantha]|uniref:Uncharacterized protein ycf68 n=1 Tax=Mikania micrantha TaxID=192012 RepID=A0A5N6PRH3_9ASTR|nr:hypothetical protein E3N88_06962 [Mikania micrantha]
MIHVRELSLNNSSRSEEMQAGITEQINDEDEYDLQRIFAGAPLKTKRIEETSDSFMHALLGSGDIAQLVELHSCNWVVAITGWMSNCPGGNDRILDLRGGGLPCGGCQRFESAYLQLVNLADTKLYDITQFFRFDGSIYDLSFMDIDKIHPFSSALRWHNLKMKGGVQTRKGLRWIPRQSETRKGVVSDEMLRIVENKHRFGDSRIDDDDKNKNKEKVQNCKYNYKDAGGSSHAARHHVRLAAAADVDLDLDLEP